MDPFSATAVIGTGLSLATSTGGMAAIAAGSAALGATTSILAARDRNQSLSAAQDAADQNLQLRRQEAARQAQTDRHRRLEAAHQIAGRIRATASDAGIAVTSGSVQAMLQQTEFDKARNLGIISDNLDASTRAALISRNSTVASLGGQTNVGLAGFQGGMSGLSTGLSIINAGNSLQSLMAERAKTASSGVGNITFEGTRNFIR